MARRFARRRKQRQLWLPVLGNRGVDNEGQITPGSSSGGVNIYLTGNELITWEAVPLTYDQGADQFSANPFAVTPTPIYTLRDLVAGNEWFLRRVVGKVFVGVFEADGTPLVGDRAPAVECGFGLIVCNTDDDGTPTTNFNEVNPLVTESQEDPWIFHRQWLLSTTPRSAIDYRTVVLTGANAASELPLHNALCGSVADGPHVDQKTARRIHRSERLFGVFAMRATRFDDQNLSTADISCYCHIRLRLLGNIRAARGNRGNASR